MLVDTCTPAVNGGTKVVIFGCVTGVTVVGAVTKAVTPIFVENGIAMVAPMAVGTVAPTVGADACVDCTCEDDFDDAEVPLIVGLVIVFKDLPLLKCIHKQEIFLKNFTKNSYRFPENTSLTRTVLKKVLVLEKSLKCCGGFYHKSFEKNEQTGSHWMCQFIQRCFWETIRVGFGYYKQDQTRNPRTCCAYCFQKIK